MINYDDLPLFPLHVVLYPEMPLPLLIFEPRYRTMIQRCRAEKSPFGVILIQSGQEVGEDAVTHSVGTTARLLQYEEQPDGRIQILVSGETRFRVRETRYIHPYASAKVEPFWEQTDDPLRLQSPFDRVTALFRRYLKALFAVYNRPLSALQLPQEPEQLSYAVASALQIPLLEKQRLLELTTTEERLQREIELLNQEISAQTHLRALRRQIPVSENGVILPVSAEDLRPLASLN